MAIIGTVQLVGVFGLAFILLLSFIFGGRSIMSVMDFIRGSVLSFLISMPFVLPSLVGNPDPTFLILLYWVIILVWIIKNLANRHFAFALGIFFGPMILWPIILSFLLMLIPS